MSFLRAFSRDIRILFSRPTFYVSTVLIALFLYLGCLAQIRLGTNTVYHLDMWASGLGFSMLVFIVFPLLPYALQFCDEWSSGVTRYLVLRCGKIPYAISKVVTSALSGWLALFCGRMLFIFLLSLHFPLFSPESINILAEENGAFSAFLTAEQGWIFFSLSAWRMAMGAAAFSVFSLWISTHIPNRFVVLAAPLILYYCGLNLSYVLGLPVWLNYSYLFFSTISFGSLGRDITYVIVYTLVFCLLFGCLTLKDLKRRVEHA